MITIRCRLLQTLEFFIIISVFWVVVMFIFWHVKGPCHISNAPPVDPFYKHITSGSVWKDPANHVTPVYIVEEHHEVLLYWFNAAEKGLIKRHGNVLLHIDGHPDGAPPESRDILPMFRWPSVRDIYNMMQRNDVFIMAAAFTGLIKRYIWVRPPWDINDTDSLPLPSDPFVVSLKLGTVNRTDPDGRLIEDYCLCTLEYDHGGSRETCVMDNMTHPEHIDVIENHRCKIQVDEALIEVVSEPKAIELLKSGTWITSLDSVILDLDEDYYGVEAAVLPLYDVNITEPNLTLIKYFIMNLFCPSKPKQEREADKFYADLLDRVIQLKQLCFHNENATYICKDPITLYRVILKPFNDIIAGIQNRNLKSALCKSDKITSKAIRGLLRQFLRYNPKQLEALKEVGICFFGSPRTLMFDPSIGMRTCDGDNRPNNTAVLFHTPTEEEMTFRTRQLKVILSSEHLHPGMISVCRSVRDGYTPRHLFHRIEEDVLRVLKDSFKTVDDTSIVYDPYLLGGVSGWYKRH